MVRQPGRALRHPAIQVAVPAVAPATEPRLGLLVPLSPDLD